MDVLAVVVVTGSHVLEPLAGVPVVVRSVRAALAVSGIDRVAVVTPGPLAGRVGRACAGEDVTVHVGTMAADHPVAHAGQRPGGTGGDGRITAGAVLVLDGARPFVPASLVERVVDAVRTGHRAVVPVLPLSDTVKIVDDTGHAGSTVDRAGLRVVQTPQGFHPSLLADVLAVGDPVHAWTGAGGTVHTVDGDPLAFPVRDAWHRDLARSTIAQEDR